MGDESSASAKALTVTIGVPLIRVTRSDHDNYGCISNTVFDRSISRLCVTPDTRHGEAPSRVQFSVLLPDLLQARPGLSSGLPDQTGVPLGPRTFGERGNLVSITAVILNSRARQFLK